MPQCFSCSAAGKKPGSAAAGAAAAARAATPHGKKRIPDAGSMVPARRNKNTPFATDIAFSAERSQFPGTAPFFARGTTAEKYFHRDRFSRLDRYNAICYDNSTLCTAYQLLQYKLIKPGPLARSRVTQVTVECFTHGTVSYSYWFRGCFFAHERLVP